MTDMSDERGGRERRARSLRDALRRVKVAAAERSDVVVELRDAERARLEMLADELRAVFADVPADDETFVFNLGPGTPPRLWIDLTSFVVLAEDRRTYRFIKDSRLGRTIIRETDDLDAMADTVTDYVAERIVERERAIEGEWVARRERREESARRERVREARMAGISVPAPAGPPASIPTPPMAGIDRAALGWIAAAFLLGLLLSAIVLSVLHLLGGSAGAG